MRRTLLVVVAVILSLPMIASGQGRNTGKKPLPQTPKVTWQDQFPIKKFWDDALATSKISGRPTLAFNVDYVDSASITFRDRILRDPNVQKFLNEYFELAVNDYSTDPPMSVGFDSLRNLGLRLDALEKGYLIALRPTAIMIRPDRTEIDRISHPERLTPKEFIEQLSNYLAGKGTIEDLRTQFWRDSTNMNKRVSYLEKLVERSEYDSTIRHLSVLAESKNHPELAKESKKRIAYMRFETEHKPKYLSDWIATLSHSKEDSADAVTGMFDLLNLYQTAKKVDSLSVWYENIMKYLHDRDPDLLNNYAWDLVHFSTRYDSSLALVSEAIAKKATEPNYYDTRALIYSMKKDFDAAIKDAEYALAIVKDEKDYFADRVEFYKQSKKEAEEDKKHPEQKKQ